MESLRQEMRSFIGVSVESLRGEIRLVADGVLTNGRRIDEQSHRIDENTGRVDTLSGRVGSLEDTVSGLSVRVGSLEHTVSRVFADHEARFRALE